MMKGSDLRDRRKAIGYTQETLCKELGVKSRQTVVSWEKSEDELPRVVELAIMALELLPECRRIHGRRPTAQERREYKNRLSVPS